ncbi:hypothetical protein MSS93_08915 [Deinococcus radiodurans]|nr:hypothetical protein MSS93_08915 [Deinococcus radiodurans]
MLGTLFPVLVEEVRGIRTSVGEPFYNYFAIPLGLLLLLVMGVGPVLPWRKAGNGDLRSLWALTRWPVAAAVVGTVLAFALGVRNVGLALTLGLCAYNVVGLGQLVAGSARARGGLGALPGLVREYPRRYGAYVAHLGIVLIAIGIGFSGTYKARQEVTLRPNVPQTVLGKTLTLTNLGTEQRPERQSIVATVQAGSETLMPKLNTYVNMPQQVAMPAVKYHLMGDTYVTLLSGDVNQQWATVAVIDSPLVGWIWWGGLVLLLGTALSVTAPVRETVAVRAPARGLEGVTA